MERLPNGDSEIFLCLQNMAYFPSQSLSGNSQFLKYEHPTWRELAEARTLFMSGSQPSWAHLEAGGLEGTHWNETFVVEVRAPLGLRPQTTKWRQQGNRISLDWDRTNVASGAWSSWAPLKCLLPWQGWSPASPSRPQPRPCPHCVSCTPQQPPYRSLHFHLSFL